MIDLRCTVCRKLLFGQGTLLGRRCPLCETGLLEYVPVVTPQILYEAETGGWYDVEALS